MDVGAFVRSTLWLTAGNLLNRILGLVFRILLGRFLDPARLGTFQLALSLYFSLLTPVVAGLPDAVARVTARSGPNHHRLHDVIVRTVALASAGVAIPAAGLLLTGWTPPGPGWAEARRAVPLMALLPAVILAAASAVIRGFFLGADRSLFIVGAQLAEQVIRVGALALVTLAVPSPWAPLTFMVGLMVAGEAAGFLVTWQWYVRHRRQQAAAAATDTPGQGAPLSSTPARLFEILTLAAPATVERILLSAARLVEATLVPTRLVAAGLTVQQALAVYGELNGLAAPLLLLPTVFSGALAAAIVPAVAQAESDPARLRQQVRRVVAVSLHLGVLAAVLFYREGHLLSRLLFPDAAAGDHPGAGRLVIWLAPAAILLYTDQVASAILRGLGHPLDPMLVDLASATARVAVVALAVGRGTAPEAAVQAVCWAMLADVMLAGCGNLLCALWRTGTRPDFWGWAVLPGCAGLAALWILNGLGPLMGDALPGRLLVWATASTAVAVVAWVAAGLPRPSRGSLPA